MAEEILLERYEILERLGKGGFGEVFKAFDAKMKRVVAIKKMDASRKASSRALSEARAAAKLNHPNVVTVHELERDSHYYYLVMEFIDGVSLAEILEAKPQLSMEESLDIAIQIAEALEVAHLKGVIHRDIKPENIMITKNGEVKVTDFGIAHLASSTLTKEGDILGTFAYMSPEQARGGRIDARTDIFSLGVVLYQMLTGEAPFSATTPGGIVFKVLNLEPQPVCELNPAVPAELEEVVFEGLEKERKDRLADATRFYQRLERFREGKVSPKRVLRPLYRLAKNRLAQDEFLPGRLGRLMAIVTKTKLAVAGFLSRHQSVFERAFNALIIALACWYLLSKSTFYPPEIARFIPLAILLAVFALPRAGVIIALLTLFLPLANFSLILALFYLVALSLYGLSFFLTRPIHSVFTLVSPVLTQLGVGLAFPVISGLFWNPLQAFAIGTIGGFASELVDLLGSGKIRYMEAPNTYRLLSALSGEINPLSALKALVNPFIHNPLLMIQPLLWGGVAVLISLLIRRKSAKKDLFGLFAAIAVLLFGELGLLTQFSRHLSSIDHLMQSFLLSLIIVLGLVAVLPRERGKEEIREEEEYTELIVG